MINLSTSLSAESLAELRKLERTMPQVYRRAFGFSVSLARRKLAAVVRKGGGKDGVEKFPAKDALTRKLHGRGKWYGSLGNGSVIRAWKSGGAQYVGWVWSCADFVSKLQEAKSEQFSRSTRHYLHKRLASENIPSFYSRPARRVIDPFAAMLGGGTFASWVAGAAENITNGKVKTPERHAVSETKRARKGSGMSYETANHGK